MPAGDFPRRPVDLLVLLHGVAAEGSQIAPLGAIWVKRLAGVRFAAPDAPFAWDHGPPGRQWYSLEGVTGESRAARVAAAAGAFDAVVDRAIAEAGTTAARTVLVGFSQGGTMALDAVARGRDFAGLIGLSTRLVTPPSRRLDGFSLRLVHGDADEVIPIGEGERARDAFAAVGAAVDLVRVAGGGHGIGPAAGSAGLAYLRRLVAPATA